MKQWLVMRILAMYQSSSEKLLEWEHLAHSGTSQQGRWDKVPLSRQIYASQWKKDQFYGLLSCCSPVLLTRCTETRNSKPSENRGTGYQRKIKSSFLSSCSSTSAFFPFLLSATRARNSARRAQPAWQWHLPCTGTVTLPGLPWKACKASLAFGAQSSGYRSTSIHLFYVFSLPEIGGRQGKCSGGNKYGVMLSYLARNCSYTYFHSISGGVINNHYLLWPILPFLFFSINVSSLRE